MSFLTLGLAYPDLVALPSSRWIYDLGSLISSVSSARTWFVVRSSPSPGPGCHPWLSSPICPFFVGLKSDPNPQPGGPVSANLSGLYPSASLTRLNPKEINLQSVQPSGSKRHASPTTAARLHSICGEDRRGPPPTESAGGVLLRPYAPPWGKRIKSSK